MSIEFWRSAGIIVTALGQTTFILLYATFPWWRSLIGRALFLKGLSFAVLLDVAVAGRLFDWGGEDAWFVVLYWVVGVGVWYQTITFLWVRLGSAQEQKRGVGA